MDSRTSAALEMFVKADVGEVLGKLTVSTKNYGSSKATFARHARTR